jgi:uncharacterized phage-associated protein
MSQETKADAAAASAHGQGHDARSVANSLIERGMAESVALTPLQIMKLVYISHGWMLGLYNRSLFKQPVLAWLYGPVVSDIYHGLRKYRASGVDKKMGVEDETFDEYEDDLISQVYKKYGCLSGIRLSQLTHAPGTPWHEIWHGSGRNSIIPNDLIKEHYAEMAERAA